jgi:hypothetical protein
MILNVDMLKINFLGTGDKGALLRIRRIRMFLRLLDPDLFVRGTDPDPSFIKQK